jgi:hypothetical protein
MCGKSEGMAVNATHLEYDANLPAWLRARDVLAGEDAVKTAGEKYLLRLDDQTNDEYAAYRARAAFFNASARTADGYLGLVFRRPPFVKAPGDEPANHANYAKGGTEPEGTSGTSKPPSPSPRPSPSGKRERDDRAGTGHDAVGE